MSAADVPVVLEGEEMGIDAGSKRADAKSVDEGIDAAAAEIDVVAAEDAIADAGDVDDG